MVVSKKYYLQPFNVFSASSMNDLSVNYRTGYSKEPSYVCSELPSVKAEHTFGTFLQGNCQNPGVVILKTKSNPFLRGLTLVDGVRELAH